MPGPDSIKTDPSEASKAGTPLNTSADVLTNREYETKLAQINKAAQTVFATVDKSLVLGGKGFSVSGPDGVIFISSPNQKDQQIGFLDIEYYKYSNKNSEKGSGDYIHLRISAHEIMTDKNSSYSTSLAHLGESTSNTAFLFNADTKTISQDVNSILQTLKGVRLTQEDPKFGVISSKEMARLRYDFAEYCDEFILRGEKKREFQINTEPKGTISICKESDPDPITGKRGYILTREFADGQKDTFHFRSQIDVDLDPARSFHTDPSDPEAKISIGDPMKAFLANALTLLRVAKR